MKRVFTFLFALAFLGTTALALADVPTEMSVQGRLTNGAGAPVPAGLKNFTFKIWDSPAGGTEIWPAGPGELQTLTTDANGLWNAGVGQIIPLTEVVFLSPVRWLEVTVNDGVNPPETLPRIELRTNPYTYRAATSQQADSLAGNSFADISDLFVNEAADTMSGMLRVDWDHTNSVGAPLEVKNLNDGYPGGWAYSSGTWGMGAEVASDNAFWNIAVAGRSEGANTNNIGAYGYASGTNSFNYGVYGVAFGGTDNLAGYFDGDIQVNGSSIGNSTVRLPVNAVSSGEILDEPGLTNGEGGIGIPVGAGIMTDVVTVTITTPSTGYIYLVGTTCIETTGNVGSGWNYIQIDETAGGGFSIPERVVFAGFTTYPNASFISWSLSTQNVYSKVAGTYTFRLEAMETGSGTSSAHDPTLTAIFLPTSYGAVVAVASASEAHEYESSRPVQLRQGATNGAVPAEVSELVEVDLRELELRALRAEAEAETARRVLAEARLGSLGAGTKIEAQGRKP